MLTPHISMRMKTLMIVERLTTESKTLITEEGTCVVEGLSYSKVAGQKVECTKGSNGQEVKY